MCQPGFECPYIDKDVMNECKDGSYSIGGKSNCTECPAGFACPSKTDDLQIPCYLGSYTLNKARVINYTLYRSIVFSVLFHTLNLRIERKSSHKNISTLVLFSVMAMVVSFHDSYHM